MKPRTILIGIIVIIIAVIIMIVASKPHASPLASQPVRVGSSLFLTGDNQVLGSYIQDGALLAVKELKGQGANIEYVSEDDKTTPEGAAAAAQKLTSADHVDAAFTASVQEVKPSADVFEKAKVPLVATWDSNQYIKTTGDQVFTIGFSTEDAGQKMAQYAFSVEHLSKVAIIYQQDEWSSLIADAFQKEFVRLGGTITVDEKMLTTNRDSRTLILKAESSGSQGIYFPFVPGTIASFVTQAHQANFKGLLMTGDSMAPSDVTDSKGFAEGLVFTNLFSEGTDHVSDLAKKYDGKEPGDLTFASMGYDAVRTIYQATLMARKENISVADALRKTKLQGTGTEIDFAGRQYSEKFEKLYQVKNGQFVEIKE